MSILRSVSHSSGLSATDARQPVFGWVNSILDITSTSETDGFPALNLLNSLTYQRWVSEDTGSDVTLELTMDSDNLTNYVAFAVHNLSDYSITIYGKTTDSPSDFNEIFESTAIDDNTPLIMEFREDHYIALQIKIVGSGARYAAVLYAGQFIRATRSVKVTSDIVPINRALKTDVLSGFSESANFLGRLVRNQVHESKLEFANYDPTEFNDINDWIQGYVPTTPFFVAWAPQDFPSHVGFVWATDSPVTSKSTVTGNYSVVISFRGFA